MQPNMANRLSSLLLALVLAPTVISSSITHQGGSPQDGISTSDDDALDQWIKLKQPLNATKGSRLPARAAVADADMLMSSWSSVSDNLFKRQREEDENGALLCRRTGKCVDHSCCGPDGICGYGPDFCGDGCQNDCDAVAMCGKYADPAGNGRCGLDLCCSWGGWCGTSDVHCIGPNEHALCLPEHGKCELIRPQTCGENSGTSNGRMIGYYQAGNTRDRVCNGIAPHQIKTDDYTHLFFSFASIDPSTYRVKPWVPEDVPIMREFTKLKGKGRNLEPWIAVGGWQFSEPSEPTHNTWSMLCAERSRRSDFIASLIDFMDEYGFTGADLDWEYPGTKERGGGLPDIENFVLLVKEMREAFGSKYGISLTLAPDYWYLRYFDVGGLEPYVDHMGFMAYDLHGFWDADVDALGSIVRGQANIEEIRNNTLPLAYAGLNPAKVTLGVAWYGRGYTLSDPSCNTLNCPFSGPSKPGKCTGSAGVLSLVEIQEMINSGKAKSNLLADIGMKELVWDDQWIGYDDEETVELKRKFANDQCFGGLMAWSVDFNSGPGDDSEPPKSTDGQCGPEHKGATCPGSGFGDCCSSSGWCGSEDGHCGSGCISGECQEGGETTDGRCGAGFNDFTCGNWEQGSCCSAGGWCGSSDAHCGDGCQSCCDGTCDDEDDENDEDDDDNGNPQPYDPDPGADKSDPNCPYEPTTLDEVFNLNYANELPTHCVPQYMIPIFQTMLEDATERYNKIMEDGYDHYYGVYSEYLVDNAQAALYEFLKDSGDDYFDCDVWQEYPCCTSCEFEKVSCNGCIKECNIESPWDDGHEWHIRDQPCPPDYSQRGIGDDWRQSIFWSFQDDDKEEDFYVAASAEIGAPADKFKVTDRMRIPSTHFNYPCAQEFTAGGWENLSDECKREDFWFDVPVVDSSFDEGDVVNPKSIVKQSLEDAQKLVEPMAEFGLAMMAFEFDDDEHDIIDAIILPVFMMNESIKYMEVVVETAKDIEEANKTAFIVNLLSSLLILVGFGGTALASAGMRILGRTLVYLAEAGHAGIGIHAVVSVPESAPLLIFGLIMSGVGIRDVNKVSRAATIRRSMEFDEIAAFGQTVARNMENVKAWNAKRGKPIYC